MTSQARSNRRSEGDVCVCEPKEEGQSWRIGQEFEIFRKSCNFSKF